MRGWDFGPVLCDAWLTLDYVASNTSVMNLLIISIGKVERKKMPFLCNSVYFYEKTVNIFLIVYKIVTYQLLILLNIGISEKVIPFITFYMSYIDLNIPNIIDGPYGPKIMVIALRSFCQNISEL